MTFQEQVEAKLLPKMAAALRLCAQCVEEEIQEMRDKTSPGCKKRITAAHNARVLLAQYDSLPHL